jgi:hypothetical protein
VNLSTLSICKSTTPVDVVNQRYALGGTDEDWDAALSTKRKSAGDGMVVAVKSGKEKKRKGESMNEVLDEFDKSNEKKKTKKKHHK